MEKKTQKDSALSKSTQEVTAGGDSVVLPNETSMAAPTDNEAKVPVPTQPHQKQDGTSKEEDGDEFNILDAVAQRQHILEGQRIDEKIRDQSMAPPFG